MSLKRFFTRGQWDDERAREIEAHLAIETDDNIARGMTPDAAARAARRKLGNVTRIREEIYDMNSMSLVETARLDVRDAVRQLRRRPLVTTLGFLLLAIGLGASAAAFSVVYGVFLRPLPYPDADRLAVLWEDAAAAVGRSAIRTFRDITQSVRFDRAAIFESGRATLTSGGDADRVSVIDCEPRCCRSSVRGDPRPPARTGRSAPSRGRHQSSALATRLPGRRRHRRSGDRAEREAIHRDRRRCRRPGVRTAGRRRIGRPGLRSRSRTSTCGRRSIRRRA
jgi:hypothetical protein